MKIDDVILPKLAEECWMNKISDDQEKAEFVNFINVLLWGDESSWMDEDTEVESQYRGYQYDRYDWFKKFKEVALQY